MMMLMMEMISAAVTMTRRNASSIVPIEAAEGVTSYGHIFVSQVSVYPQERISIRPGDSKDAGASSAASASAITQRFRVVVIAGVWFTVPGG